MRTIKAAAQHSKNISKGGSSRTHTLPQAADGLIAGQSPRVHRYKAGAHTAAKGGSSQQQQQRSEPDDCTKERQEEADPTASQRD